MNAPGRRLLAMTVLVAALATGSAAEPSSDGLLLLGQVNAVRRQLGLTPLRSDPTALNLVSRMARGDRTDRAPEFLEAQPDCAVCDVFFEGGGSTDPRAVYRSLGGRRAIRFGIWRASWSAQENLSVFFAAAALVLDPRARTFDAAATPLGMLVVGVTADETARFDRAIRWPQGEIDPRRQLWAAVSLPPGYGYPNLYDVRGGREVTVAYPLAAVKGFRGSRLVSFGLNTSLAYGRQYHVGAPQLGVRLKTRAAPAAFLRRSWTFQSVEPAERGLFLDAVQRTPPYLRSLLNELDGAVTVVGGREGCLIADACEDSEGDRATIGIAPGAQPFVVLHELGHVVFDLALDERARRVFRTMIRRARWQGACCFQVSEGFADQFAFSVLGGVPVGIRSYSGGQMVLSAPELSEFIREHAAYRPLSARGLLPR